MAIEGEREFRIGFGLRRSFSGEVEGLLPWLLWLESLSRRASMGETTASDEVNNLLADYSCDIMSLLEINKFCSIQQGELPSFNELGTFVKEHQACTQRARHELAQELALKHLLKDT